MTATITNRSTATARHGLLRATAGSALLAATTVELLTGVVRATGTRLSIDGSPITFGACAVALAMCLVPAAAVLLAVRRFVTSPARTWVRCTAALTAVSLLPDLAVTNTSTATRLTMIAAHLLAAAIIVPAVAGRIRQESARTDRSPA